MRWTLLIPAKALPAAKSRLAAMSDDPEGHRRLVEAIRADTIAATRSVPAVARVLVVTDVGVPGPELVVQMAPGLNAAIREAAAVAAGSWPQDGIAALVGDLPALRPDELSTALDAAATVPAAFVPDRDGTGTTLLTATPGHALRPEFGPGSAARHRRRSTPLDAGPGLRHDVDTADDLRAAAAELGVGPATGDVLAQVLDHSAPRDVTVRSPCIGMIPE